MCREILSWSIMWVNSRVKLKVKLLLCYIKIYKVPFNSDTNLRMLGEKILPAWFFFQIFLYFLVKHKESLMLHQMSLRLDFTPTFKFCMVGVTSKSYLLLSTCLYIWRYNIDHGFFCSTLCCFDLTVKWISDSLFFLFFIMQITFLHLQLPYQICDSPYCQPYYSYNSVSSENLELDQLIIP